MKKLYKLLLICLLILSGGIALKAQSYNSDNSETANRAETPTYISKIAVAYGAKESTPKDILKNNSFTIIDKDLNDGCGASSHYIYMGYKTTTEPANAITGIYIREGSNPPNSATFDGVTAYLLGGSTEDNPGENKPVDLNIDAGGATLHVYVSRSTNLAAITDIKFSNTNSMSGYVTQNIDLNKGASGEYIYLHYKQFSGKASATFHYLNSSGSRTSSTTSVSVKHHQQAVNNTPSAPTSVTYDGRTWTLLGWREDNNATTAGSNPSYTYMDSKVYRAVYSADVSLTYNANGGSNAPSKQTAKQYVNAGSSSIAKSNTSFTIPSTTPTHDATKCNFAGWSTSSSSTTAQYQAGGSISINTNTTLYAVWPEHNGTQTYVNNGSNHTYTWSCCEKSVTEDHIYDNGIDNYCGAHIHEIDGNGYCHLCDGYPAELVNGYYEIYNAGNLFWFAEYVNTIDRTASAKLMNDIDLENRPWTPIGTTGETSHNFRGHFDGNGKTITGLNVTVTRNGGGFFGEVRLGTVEDFTIYGEVKLNGNHSYVGGVIGSAPGANSNQPEHNGATIRNITSYVNVTLGEGSHGSNRVAGFIGYANHETLIENCTWYGTLDLGPYRAQDGVGGLVGKANDNSEITIRNCAAYGTIKTSYQSGSYNSHNSIYIGGIVSNSVASAQTTLENCIWAGTLVNNTDLGSNAHISAIGSLNGIKSVSNCYALDNMPYITTNDEHNTGITEVTAGQLASGEIAYKLQGTQATQIWGQNIDNEETANAKPILGGAKVYEHTFDGTTLYSNSQTLTAGGKCGDNLYWTVSDNTLTIFGTGAMDDYLSSSSPWKKLETVPTSLVMEEGITHIGDYAFYDCKGFTGSLTIPNSITTIGNAAFGLCTGFTGSLTIPNSVTTIGYGAFLTCYGFKGSLTIGDSVTTIGYEAFHGCRGFSGDLTIPNSVTTIGHEAFYNCYGFKGSLTIGDSVTTIGYEAFYNCSGFTGSLTIPNSVTTIGNKAFYNCSGFTGSLTIGDSVTSIGNYAFENCSGFTEVYSSAVTAPTLLAGAFDKPNNATLYYPVSSEQSYKEKGWFNYFPQHVGVDGKCGDNLYWKVSDNTLTIFGTGAMYNYSSNYNPAPWCSLNPAPTSLVLEEGIKYIGNYAFYGCDGFTKVYSFAETVPTLGTDAFANINVNATLYYPASSKPSYDDKGWFNYFSKCIGFKKCGDNLYWAVSDNVLTIFGTGAMDDYEHNGDNISPWRKLETAPTSLLLEEGVTHIGNFAFYNCSDFKGSLTIPNSVTTIGNYAFQLCISFKGSLTIGNSVTTIGNDAFYSCSGFTGSLTIPNSVTTIGNYAFFDCYGFNGYLTIGNCVNTIGDYAFSSCKFSGSLTIPNSVTTIGNSAFKNCSGFAGSLTIPNSVTSIGNNAFHNCKGFTGSLTIPNSVTTIGFSAFQNCSGFNGSLTIPNSVTSIRDDAFQNCSGFKGSLTIPNSVTSIGSSAFQNCSGFNGSLTIPNSVTTIGSSAFRDCSGFTSSLTIPNSVTSIGNYAFQNCSGFNGSLTIPNSVTTIGNAAFQNCSGFNGSLTIPNSVTTIGYEAFENCSGFTEVYSSAVTAPTLGTEAFANINENAILYHPVSSEPSYEAKGWFEYFPQHVGFDGKCGDNLYWKVSDNTLTIFGTGAMYDYGSSNQAPWCSLNPAPTSLVLEEGISSIGNYAFYLCSGFKGSLTTPNSVTTIGNYAFYDCSGFKGSLTIPNSVTSIGERAFRNCSGFNGSLTIGNSVTTIGDYAFYECLGFNGSLTIPNSVTSIGNSAFQYCSSFNGSLTIGNSVTSIGNSAFYDCEGFTEVYSFAETAPTLGTDAFANINENATLYYPSLSKQSYEAEGWFNYFSKRIGYKKCGDNLYWYVNDNNILTIFGTGAMYDYGSSNQAPWRSLNTAPTSLVLEEGITHIGNYAFSSCKFSGSLTIPNSVTSIGNSAFHNCKGFTGSLTIPNSVTTIGNDAFGLCTGFTGSLTIPNSVTTIGNSAFQFCDGFNGSLTIGNSVTTIGNEAFYYCDGFNGSLTIGNSVTTIGDWAFFKCYGFKGSLTIGDSVTSIGNSAFSSCKFSGSLTIPNSVTSIGENAFSSCSGFNGSLTIGNSVTTIGECAFQLCSGFTGSLTIGNSVTTIGNEAFYDCDSFNGSLTIGNSVTTIGNDAFAYCSGFTGSLTIPNSVTTIGNEAFYGCSSFNGSLTIPNSVTSIGNYAFAECSGFTGSLTIPNSVTSIGDYAFRNCSGFTGSLTIPNSVKSIGDEAFYYCKGFTEVYTSAETAPTLGTNAFDKPNNAILYYPASSEQSYDDKGWFNYFSKCIGFNGKCGDNLYWHVDNENTLTIFGTGAMYDYNSYGSNISPWNNLGTAPTSLVLEEGITTIGDNAFYNCFKFTGSLTIPNSVTTIGDYAFYNCFKFTGSLTIPNSVTTIGDYAFAYCEGFTGSLTIPNSVTTIGNNAFYICIYFNEVHSLAETVPTLGNDAFSYINKNATLYYPASSEQSYEEEGWFGYFSKHFGFGKCGENLYWSVDDKNALTIFGTGAMYDFDSNDTPWKNLNPAPTSLVLKEGITYIGKYAFYECYDLTDVHSSAVTAPTLGTDAFANINENATLYYPSLSEHSYEAEGWFNYFQQLIGLNGKCGENLYWYVNDENTLTIFGSGNMWDYDNSGNNISPWRKLETSPTSLVLKEGITHIGIYAFENCSGFTGSLTIPNSVTSIGESAFYNCSGFTGSLTIPNSVTCIRYGTFYNCSGFNGSLTIPNSVNYIEHVAFRGCSGFTGTLTIGNSVTTIKDYAFYQCSGFTGSLTIPNSVTSIGDEAFYNCSGFTDIFFYRDANPTIATSAFFYINANAKVYAPVIWESFSNIPEDKLVKMATFVGEQSAVSGQQSGWVFPEGMTEVSADAHVAINAPLVLGQQTTDNRQQTLSTLSVKSFGLCGNGTTVNGRITIEDGGQLYCEVARGEVTVKKEIVGYQQSAVSGQQSESESKWYTIASPLKDTIQIIPNSSFLTSNSDLYRYDEPSYTWQNAKNSANNGFNTIDPGRGYLYANAENTTLEFTGMINTDDVTYNLTTDGDKLNGFHLVGNPFTHDITFAHLNATEGASLVNGYYVLNGEGAWGATLGSNGNDVIKVGQGVLVKATAEGTLAIAKTTSQQDYKTTRGQQTTDNGQQSLCISVSNAKYSDRAFVVFDKGVGLDKMNHENEDIPLLYIPMEDADYAIAMMDMNVNEIPVNFETNVMGEYTISLRQENCEFDELYLLDKETDEKVNILEQDYTFIATSSENPERFILMKDAQGSQLEAHSHFAYINNDDIVIYNIEGDADIKIFDALGRCVYQGESSDETTRIANGYSSGVYMIQKVDDKGVKVQKVMID